MPSYYSFLPYLRQGLSSLLTHQDNYNDANPVSYPERATTSVSFNIGINDINGAYVAPLAVNRSVQLKGPGDITGINSTAIVKTSPVDWVTNMEPNFLPYIEFYDEDFPWRYTPAAAKDQGGNKFRLRPWIALIVLEESEFDEMPFNGIVPTIKILGNPSSLIPPAEQMWAWAHVHVNKDISNTAASTGTPVGDALINLRTALQQDPDQAVSRLLCPRKLKPNTGYHAFVIPSFETGRLAGIGAGNISTTDALKSSWRDVTAPAEFPVYHRWFFKTADAGDFESLVRLLEPRILDDEVGKRAIDLQRSGNKALESVAPPRPVIDLEGVLKPLNTISDDWDISKPYPQQLKELLNKPVQLATQYNVDPVIAPPIYGCWHIAVNELGNPVPVDWLHEANLDPRFRLFAGAGAEVIRKNQDAYMQIAWEQVGEVLEANRKIRQMQLSQQASAALHDKHIKKMLPLSEELLLNLSAPVHVRIKIPTNTVYQAISESILPVEMFTGAFRRLTRPNGPLMSTLDITGSVTTQSLIADVNNNSIQPMTAYQTPSQINTYTVWQSVPNAISSTFVYSLNQVQNFILTVPNNPVPPPINGPNSLNTQQFVTALASMNDIIASLTPYQYNNNPSLDIATSVQSIITKTEPRTTVLELAKSIVKNNAAFSTNPQSIPTLDVVLAAPRIRLPMYKELAALAPDWLMPGLNSIRQNSINLLRSDQRYIEAYMLGLNYEMARELLWRGYPTDQRGTCFSFFWGYNNANITYTTINNYQVPELDPFRDIKDIHTWKAGTNLTLLGANTARTTAPGTPLLVLTVRGELLRKYPGTIIYLQKSKWPLENGVPVDTKHREEDTTEAPKYPVFSAHVAPDIYFLGFEGVTADKVRGSAFSVNPNDAGYFFVFQERAGEIRFGADVYQYDPAAPNPPNQNINKWDDLSWGQIADNYADQRYVDMAKGVTVTGVNENPESVTWNDNAASVAYALLQSPVRLLVHGVGLIPPS